MAQLTTLDEKIGEVIGLAMASKDATAHVEQLLDDQTCLKTVRRMHDDAAKLEQMGTELVSLGQFEGRKTAILDKARETRQEAKQMMQTYLDDDSDGLDGFEFLTMAEAGEVGHWKVVETLNLQFGDRDIKELTDFAVPLQEQHLAMTLDGSIVLASQEDPTAPS
jgi:hypothetical protein